MVSNNKGVTLIEILISMAILAGITFATSTSLRSSIQLKTKITSKITRQAKFRSALRLIDRDIRLGFNYRDITFEIYQDIKNREKEILTKKTTTGSETPESGSDDDAPPTPTAPGSTEAGADAESTLVLLEIEKYQKDIKDPTHFYGEKSELHFTNTNNIKISAKDTNSIQQEVGYMVKNCRNRIDPEKSYDCLWRRVSPSIDEKVHEGGDEFVLLENVKVFKLRYFGEPKEDWVEQWFSGDRGDAETRKRFPMAVEVSIAFEENGVLEEAVMISHIAFPNNSELDAEPSSLGSGGL